jgi:hypothetical protein
MLGYHRLWFDDVDVHLRMPYPRHQARANDDDARTSSAIFLSQKQHRHVISAGSSSLMMKMIAKFAMTMMLFS